MCNNHDHRQDDHGTDNKTQAPNSGISKAYGMKLYMDVAHTLLSLDHIRWQLFTWMETETICSAASKMSSPSLAYSQSSIVRGEEGRSRKRGPSRGRHRSTAAEGVLVRDGCECLKNKFWIIVNVQDKGGSFSLVVLNS
ncbi:hypothetical protein ACET3Z_023504 [Daucus carota]